MSKPGKRKNKRQNRTLITIGILLLLCVGLLGWALAATLERDALRFSSSSGKAVQPAAGSGDPVAPTDAQPQELRVRFSAVGDNLIHNGIYLQAQQRAGGDGYDFHYVYENVQPFFEQFDVNWINQETLVSWEVPPSTYPMFSTPGELGVAAYDAGWRVFALSNNHSYDKGATGISATLRYWEEMPDDVVTTGFYRNTEDDSGIALQEVNGVKIAYLAFTESTNGIPTPEGAEAHILYTDETETMERLVRRARELADAVVVCVHWGTENSHEIRPDQRELAASFADWGADAVIGTHPHVVQGIEWAEGTESGKRIPVAYSLGNFLSAQSQANQMIGLCYTFDICQNVRPDGTREDVRIENVKAYPTVTHYDGNYENIRCYMYRDYTDELAGQHGVGARYPGFSMEYIQEVVTTYVDPEFLVLE
ncbi:CapA family protein [Ruminococcaceae bacterium OttesenSCG-928-I18]|nr:CapA family protein [Ruminococcaceae bacterium OttesenSCG-928-I18]